MDGYKIVSKRSINKNGLVAEGTVEGKFRVKYLVCKKKDGGEFISYVKDATYKGKDERTHFNNPVQADSFSQKDFKDFLIRETVSA